MNDNKTNHFITRVTDGFEFRIDELGPEGTPYTLVVKTHTRSVTALMRVRLRALIRDAAEAIRRGQDREIVLHALGRNFKKVLSGWIFYRRFTGRIVKKAVGLTPDGRNNLYAPVSVDNSFEYVWVKA